jgi:hypothetical protein
MGILKEISLRVRDSEAKIRQRFFYPKRRRTVPTVLLLAAASAACGEPMAIEPKHPTLLPPTSRPTRTIVDAATATPFVIAAQAEPTQLIVEPTAAQAAENNLPSVFDQQAFIQHVIQVEWADQCIYPENIVVVVADSMPDNVYGETVNDEMGKLTITIPSYEAFNQKIDKDVTRVRETIDSNYSPTDEQREKMYRVLLVHEARHRCNRGDVVDLTDSFLPEYNRLYQQYVNAGNNPNIAYPPNAIERLYSESLGLRYNHMFGKEINLLYCETFTDALAHKYLIDKGLFYEMPLMFGYPSPQRDLLRSLDLPIIRTSQAANRSDFIELREIYIESLTKFLSKKGLDTSLAPQITDDLQATLLFAPDRISAAISFEQWNYLLN